VTRLRGSFFLRFSRCVDTGGMNKVLTELRMFRTTNKVRP
jgi:hypothetical protein